MVTESLRDIRLFVAVYELRSFTLAAAREHATQSGVSQHIRKLEDRYSLKLFERHKGTITPTPAARSYYDQCLEILRASELANMALERYRNGLSGTIAIGLMPTMTRSCLAPTIRRFLSICPNVNIRIVDAYSATLCKKVLDGELDFAIVPANSNTIGLESRFFLRTIETLVSSADSGQIHLSNINLKNINNLKLVVPELTNSRRLAIDNYLASNKIVLSSIIEIDTMFGTLDFIKQSDWHAILPGLMMVSDIPRQQYTVNPLSSPLLLLDLALIQPTRTVMSYPAVLFLEILEDESIMLNNLWNKYLPEPTITSSQMF